MTALVLVLLLWTAPSTAEATAGAAVEATGTADRGAGPTVLFVRGGSGTGGLSSGNDSHLSDITDASTASGNHGWKQLADLLEADGFVLTQLTEGPEQNNTPVDFEVLDLSQWDVIVLGSNNADYPAAAIDAVEDRVRAGGGLLVISDANFGSTWGDAPTSDQLFLDRFGLIVNQDLGTYDLVRGDGDFTAMGEAHPLLEGVERFDGEGVSPVSVGTLSTGVSAQVLAPAQGSIRENDAVDQGSTRPAGPDDGALLAATVDDGRVVGHFDRNTFFNENGAGTDITRFDNATYALNLFRWLAQVDGVVFVDGFESGDTTAWQ